MTQSPTSKTERDIQEAIIESNLIEGISGTEALQDSLRAWKYINDLDMLRLNDIKMIHWLITERQLETDERGTLRSENGIDVYVGDRRCPSSYLVYDLMMNWLNDAMYDDAKTAHIKFEKIHPFIDGNGRTGRLIYYWQDKKAPTIMDKDKQDYYKWFMDNK